MRKIMTAAELREHKTTDYGRDYRESCDGYGDMEAEEKRGWHAVSGWGRDGWDLGNWPYVVISTREQHNKYGLMQTVEGDRDVYWFSSEEDRSAAIDYLFLWYAAGNRWAPLAESDREALNAGEMTFDEKWRGPFSWERCEREKDATT